jgi:threonine/homoserine/homoserine lactone efflux protein
LGKYSLLQNILLGLTLAAPIGPVNLEIIKRGLNSGFRQAFLTGTGAMCADATYLTLIFFGLTAFLNIALMKIILGVAGSFILIYLGWISAKEFFHKAASTENKHPQLFIPNRIQRITRRQSGGDEAYFTYVEEADDEANKVSQRRRFGIESSFITGYALAISSPMTIVWWTAVFGALLASQTGMETNLSAFLSCLSILLGCFIWVLFLAIALHWGKKIINERIVDFISLTAGTFLIVFGIYFLYLTIVLISNVHP